MTKDFGFSTSFTSSNYYDFGTDKTKSNFETLNTFNLSLKIKKITATLGAGVDTKCNLDSVFEKRENLPAIEVKAKYDLNDDINLQGRFRKIGDTEQYRITFGGNHKLDDKNSIYSSVHLTMKNSCDDWTTNTGFWVGYTHKFNKCSLSTEVQQNIPFKGEKKPSDTSVNIIANIPF